MMSEDFLYIREQVKNWNNVVEEIGVMFQNRAYKVAREPMIEFTNIYISCLFALNHLRTEESRDLERIDELERKPLNLKERLGFLLESPNHYHAYIQLKELYVELLKMTARFEIIEQRKNK